MSVAMKPLREEATPLDCISLRPNKVTTGGETLCDTVNVPAITQGHRCGGPTHFLITLDDDQTETFLSLE